MKYSDDELLITMYIGPSRVTMQLDKSDVWKIKNTESSLLYRSEYMKILCMSWCKDKASREVNIIIIDKQRGGMMVDTTYGALIEALDQEPIIVNHTLQSICRDAQCACDEAQCACYS